MKGQAVADRYDLGGGDLGAGFSPVSTISTDLEACLFEPRLCLSRSWESNTHYESEPSGRVIGMGEPPGPNTLNLSDVRRVHRTGLRGEGRPATPYSPEPVLPLPSSGSG